MTYPNSLKALEEDIRKSPKTDITYLAIELIEEAKVYDIHYSASLRTYPSYKINGELIKRNKTNPVEYTHPSVLGAPGSDTKEKPLSDNEAWNIGRRATNTGATYKIGADGRPIHPYLEATGITGQGLLWQYGPNHAVDNGFITVKNDNDGQPAIYTLGINRKDSPKNASFSGGFLKFEINEHGEYIINEEAVINSKAEEFFEEMLSGSMEIAPSDEVKLHERFGEAVMKRMEGRTEAIDKEKLEVIQEQVKTEIKMEKVKKEHPDFFPRLKEVFAKATECFSGPILNAGRTTDNSWIESQLSWIDLSEEKQKSIIGDTGLSFAAGDDAANVKLFKMDETLIDRSDASHTAMFAFMAASYLLKKQEECQEIHPNIKSQLQGMADRLKIKNNQLAKNPLA